LLILPPIVLSYIMAEMTKSYFKFSRCKKSFKDFISFFTPGAVILTFGFLYYRKSQRLRVIRGCIQGLRKWNDLGAPDPQLHDQLPLPSGVRLTTLPPADTGFTPWERDGVPRGSAIWVAPEGQIQKEASTVVLYYHGGSYCWYNALDHYPKNMASRLVLATGLPVLAIDYRLAPEHESPDNTIQDAIDGIAYLKKRGAKQVIIAGDSAGAGLALAATAALAKSTDPETAQLLPLVHKLVLLSPYIDLTMNQEVLRTNRFDWDTLRGELFWTRIYDGNTVERDIGNSNHAGLKSLLREDDKEYMREEIDMYAAGVEVTDWRVSPVFIPDDLLEKFPPILQVLGEEEYMVEENRKFQNRARGLGVDVRYVEFPWMWHDFMNYFDLPRKLGLSDDDLPEAVACYNLIHTFVAEG